MKVRKAEEYFVYFPLSELHSRWKRSADCRRRIVRCRPKHQNAQLPFRKMGLVEPSAQMASMFMLSQPIMKSS